MRHPQARNFFLLAVLLALSACTGTRAAYRAAENPLQMATVVGEHYYSLVKEAADLKQSGSLSGSALSKVQEADRTAKPLVIEMTRIAETYKQVRDAENEAALQAALNKAVTAVNNFITALKGPR